jgi:hypothetical protein
MTPLDQYVAKSRRRALILRITLSIYQTGKFFWGLITDFIVAPKVKFALLVQDLFCIWGRKRVTRNNEIISKKQKMQHYYYHCELNPAGFAKIKSENIKEKLKKTEYLAERSGMSSDA